MAMDWLLVPATANTMERCFMAELIQPASIVEKSNYVVPKPSWVRAALKKLLHRHAPTPPPPSAPPQADVYLISFPKCGRTWLRLLIGKALAVHHGSADSVDMLELTPLTEKLPNLPTIAVTHDGDPHLCSPEELPSDKSYYRTKRVVLLARDVRDTLVSLYCHLVHREPSGSVVGFDLHDLGTFVHSKRGGLDTLLRFYRIWHENRHVPVQFLLVRYEDLHAEPHRELARVLDLIGLAGYSARTLDQAVEFARFDNMRAMELVNRFQSFRLSTARPHDPESFKTRRGRVGGYVDYLPRDLIAFIDGCVRRELPEYFGYR